MSIEVPMIPAEGDQWLAVNLSRLTVMDPIDCLLGLKQLGYTPKLGHCYYPKTGNVDQYAVLDHWTNVTEHQVSDEEFERLVKFLGEDDLALTARSKGLRQPEKEEWWAMSPEARAQACRDAGFDEQAEEELLILPQK